MSGNKSPVKLKKVLNIVENTVFTIILLFIILTLFSTAYSRIKGKEPSVLGHKLYYVASGSMFVENILYLSHNYNRLKSIQGTLNI